MSNSTITTSSSSTFSLTSSTETTSPTSSTSSTTPTTSSTPTSSSQSLVTFTSRTTLSPSGTSSPSVVTVTSTASNGTPTGNQAASASESAARASSSAAALATAGAKSSNNHGLSDGGRIAIAVVIPIVGIALLVAAAIFFWKKRKARKTAEEERRKEVEEYGYNPNNDPTLPAVGSNYGETNSEMAEDNSGYRGWGATSTQRKPSTTLGSNSRVPGGKAISDTTSSGGQYNNSQPSEGNSGDPLVNTPHGNDEVGALGGAPAAAATGQNRDLNRGPSNASSAYTGHRSEGSGDGDRPVNGGYAPPQNYYDDVTYYNEAQPNHGPYGDGSYGGGQGQPVIRDVQARRNTRIEKQSHFPQQGNAGIAQNF